MPQTHPLLRWAAVLTLMLGAVWIADVARADTTPPPVAADDDTLAKMLTGRFVGEGDFVDNSSGAKRGIKLDIVGRYDGTKLTLVEDTFFSDGEKQHKVWTFSRDTDGHWVGYRADVIGQAVVRKNGQTIVVSYKARVPRGDKVLNLSFQETYDIKSPNLIVSNTQVSYLFLTLGKADLTIRRTGP